VGDSVNRPLHIPGRRFVLTKNKILEAQKHTLSNMEAARWLGVNYNTYKKWAKYYGVFEQHLNQAGFGVKKGWAVPYKIPLDDVLSGERLPPKRWSQKVIKKRLIEEGYIYEECSNCGYNEKNLNTEIVCLSLDFMDDNSKNYKTDNLRLLCPNCYLSFNGRFSNSKSFCK
jgi:hypothetical protein|tara:strand:- start:719 stop:1231 length:513 start_codon:yes stop_codon:yes gene_type:complete